MLPCPLMVKKIRSIWLVALHSVLLRLCIFDKSIFIDKNTCT